MGRTFEIEVEDFVNLRAVLALQDYDDANIQRSLGFINDNAEPVYIHLTGNGSTEPDTGDEGIPIGTGEPSVEYNVNTADPNTVWLYAANAVTIKVIAQGAG